MKQIVTFLILLSSVALHAQSLDTTAIIEYIKKYKDISIEEMQRTGIPASITLAQGIHESGFGKSYLAQNTNNHFGIKCKAEWTGKTFKYTDDAPNECFRVYDNVEESYRDHSDFLKNRPRYADLFLLDKNDYKGWAYGLKKAGYATNPKYPAILIKLIEDFQLNAFDEGALPTYLMTKSDNNIVVNNQQNIPTKPVEVETTIELNDEAIKLDDTKILVPAEPKNEKPIPTYKVKKTVFKINKVKAVKIYTDKGETLDLIANLMNLDVEDIWLFNDMTKETPIVNGQTIFIQSKKKKNKQTTTYKVKQEDNMWSIAQKFGVQLSALLKRNKLKIGEEPTPKSTIVLKGKIKEKPSLRTENSKQKNIEKNVPIKNVVYDTITRARDTIYPTTAITTGTLIDSNRLLIWENPTKLLEDDLENNPSIKQENPSINTTSASSTSNEKFHTIVKGDTLYNISKRYNVSIDKIKDWNNLQGNEIQLGQQLKIK